MPKQIWKIDQFHGGLNSNSDPRDIAPIELSEAQDVMVDEIGKIRALGGTSAHDAGSQTVVHNPGYGLFQFSHDRVGGHLGHGDVDSLDTAETGDDYLAMADIGATVSIDIYSKENDAWGSEVISLGGSAGIKPIFYIADGVLRVGDGNFGVNNKAQWRGYIDRYFFGNGSEGFSGQEHDNGIRVNGWYSTDVSLKALEIFQIYGHNVSSTAHDDGEQDETNPIKIKVVSHANHMMDSSGSGDQLSSKADTILARAAFSSSSPNLEAETNTTPGYALFCEPGDKLLISGNSNALNNRIYTVKSISSDDPNTIEFEEGVTTASADHFFMVNLSKSDLFDQDNMGFEFAVSTLYDDSKQESSLFKYKLTGTNTTGHATDMTNADGALSADTDDFDGWIIKNLTDGSSGIITSVTANGVVSVAGGLTLGSDNSWDVNDEWEISAMPPHAICNRGATTMVHSSAGFGQMKIIFQVENYLPSSDTGFTPAPYTFETGPKGARVSGFRVYMRKENTTSWYLQNEIDVTDGNKTIGSGSDYNMWDSTYMTSSSPYAPHAEGSYISSLREVETYESMTGYSADINSVGFDGLGSGFKTAVVANRIVYVGHPRIKDEKGNLKTYGDAILKSSVGKFDSFTPERRLETDIRDGDEIVKLEEYADRLLIFKKKKMQLLNISQELEFLEETFLHKGISHPVATCKTDFGIAWVNNLGCYLYDGQKVNNLLEKGGRQIIKESDWATFTTNEPMIGYIPKKRQLVIVDDITTSGTGICFLYDIVTQSWIKGGNASFTSNSLTNFITDWNGDLVHAHTNGVLLKWDDASVNQAMIDITTKDIDFGQPGQKKKVYKVYITYKCNGTIPVIKYDTNGDTGLDKTFNEAFSSSATQWTTASFTPSTSNDANNIYSIRLRIYSSGSTTTSTFTINDISVVYRLKSVK
jgi:hypothetical protein